MIRDLGPKGCTRVMKRILEHRDCIQLEDLITKVLQTKQDLDTNTEHIHYYTEDSVIVFDKTNSERTLIHFKKDDISCQYYLENFDKSSNKQNYGN